MLRLGDVTTSPDRDAVPKVAAPYIGRSEGATPNGTLRARTPSGKRLPLGDGEHVVVADGDPRDLSAAVQLEDHVLAVTAVAVLRLDPERVLTGRDESGRRPQRVRKIRKDDREPAPHHEDLRIAPSIAIAPHIALPRRIRDWRRRRRRAGDR